MLLFFDDESSSLSRAKNYDYLILKNWSPHKMFNSAQSDFALDALMLFIVVTLAYKQNIKIINLPSKYSLRISLRFIWQTYY